MAGYTITSGANRTKGIKTVIYGVEGIGKTTLASQFPDPVFIDTEGSTTHFDNINRMPIPKDWKDINQMIDWISKEKPCKTLVIDTFDEAERMEVDALLIENGMLSIESFGYGKGYIQSAERIAKFLKKLDEKLIDKGINVTINCHSQIRKIDLPEEQGSYDKYELKLGAKTGSQTAPLLREWCDLLLFCNYRTYVEAADEHGKKHKATGGSKRVMYAQHSAVWDAKNRFGLPEEMDMKYESIQHIFNKAPMMKATATPAPAPKAEEKQADPVPVPVTAEKPAVDFTPGMLTFPDVVPDEVKKLCAGNAYTPEDVQQMLFKKGITKRFDYDLAMVPPKFWTSFVKEFDARWKDAMDDAQRERMPF